MSCRYGGAGAVWDIYARGADTEKLSHWLADNADSFVHQGKPVTVQFSSEDAASHAPIMAQKFMLVEKHRQKLLQDTGMGVCHFRFSKSGGKGALAMLFKQHMQQLQDSRKGRFFFCFLEIVCDTSFVGCIAVEAAQALHIASLHLTNLVHRAAVLYFLCLQVCAGGTLSSIQRKVETTYQPYLSAVP